MNKFVLLALASVSAMRLRKDDLPYNPELIDKVDPLSRYVNDDDLVQIGSRIRKDDLPYNPELIDKVDPLSRYVNDDDLV